MCLDVMAWFGSSCMEALPGTLIIKGDSQTDCESYFSC